MTAPGSESTVYISGDVVLSNTDVASARVVSRPSGPQISIVFTKLGAERFASATENNLMKPLGILVDGQLISAPIVRETITGGKATISGQFTEQEAKRIADGIDGR
jgi:preprotein translocase subunit SecD